MDDLAVIFAASGLVLAAARKSGRTAGRLLPSSPPSSHEKADLGQETFARFHLAFDAK